MLQKYRDGGIRHIVALRGDLPSGMAQGGEFRYANELVTFIREEFDDTFHIEVASYPEYHPQADSAQEDLLNFKRKVEAGADSVITQYFYNADAYFSFIDACEAMGIGVPIVPGIMPINRFSQLARFSDACGAEIPRWIRKKLEGYGDDSASIRAFGLDIVTDLCDRLLSAGAPGIALLYAELGRIDDYHLAAARAVIQFLIIALAQSILQEPFYGCATDRVMRMGECDKPQPIIEIHGLRCSPILAEDGIQLL